MDKWITIDNVKSSDLTWMRWNGSGILEVKFHDGHTYRYVDIPKAVWNGLKNRNDKHDNTDKYSVGKFFHAKVANGKYKFTKK